MKGGGRERRNGLSVTELHREGLPGQTRRPTAVASSSARTRTSALGRLAPVLVEVPAGGQRRAVEGHRASAPKLGGVGLACGEGPVDVPPGGRPEAHAGPLALDHHPGGDALDPAGRQPGHDLLPQHRGDLVAVEAVEDPPGLLGVHQPAVEVAPLLDRPLMAARVISWKTIRLTGTVGESTSRRCHAIDSPSRSSSVAR